MLLAVFCQKIAIDTNFFFTSILFSQPFKFIIGHQKKLFTVHESAVSRLSKSLNDLLNGSMKEANEHCVHWEDVDEKTFLRFAQWAYTGEYSPQSQISLQLRLSSQILNTVRRQTPQWIIPPSLFLHSMSGLKMRKRINAIIAE